MEKILEEFWNENIWKSDINFIFNYKIKKILGEIQHLQNKMNNKDFSTNIINENFFEINDKEYILTKINSLKYENINYIKTHAECIPEYHQILINYKTLSYITKKEYV